jgi:anti-anti-sigma regulatory factor
MWAQIIQNFSKTDTMAKAILKTEKTADEVSLFAQGELKVQHGSDLKNFFLLSIKRTGKEKLILNDVTAFDVASIQLTYLWKKSLEQQGRQVSISLPQDEGLKDLLEKTGITKFL